MSPTPPGYELIRILGIKPCWVGANPLKKGLLVGSEEGTAVFSDLTGKEIVRYQLSESKEAIDAIAGFDPYMAVSTRHEVTVFDLSTAPNTPAPSAVIPRGSHGVVAGNGCFLAPIGHDGILVITPSRDSLTNHRINTFPGNPVNFYQLCKLPDFDGASCYVAACRTQGIAVLDVNNTTQETGMVIGRFDADIVDVASLGTDQYPYAIAAVGAEGDLLLCRDIMRRERPITMKFDNLAGRVYRVLSGHGHLFIMTSKAIYTIGGLAKRLVQPKFDYSRYQNMTLPVDAIDAAVIDDQWLLTVMADSIRKYNLSDFSYRIDEFTREDRTARDEPDFKEEAVKEWSARQLANV
jgi:hypothetical protein